MQLPNLTAYDTSRQRLLDVLRVTTDPNVPEQPVRDTWAPNARNEDIHHKIVGTYRHETFTFLLSHMEKGTVHTGSVPENMVLQCIAGRFQVTDDEGRRELIVAPYSFLVLAGHSYTYEAQEEVYNIAKVNHGTSQDLEGHYSK